MCPFPCSPTEKAHVPGPCCLQTGAANSFSFCCQASSHGKVLVYHPTGSPDLTQILVSSPAAWGIANKFPNRSHSQSPHLLKENPISWPQRNNEGAEWLAQRRLPQMSSFPPPLLVHKTLGKFLETKLRMAQAGKGGHRRGGGEQSTAIISESKSGSRRHASLVMETIPRPCWGSGDSSPQSRCYWHHTGGWQTKPLAAEGSLGARG